jgi:hypothetical protein
VRAAFLKILVFCFCERFSVRLRIGADFVAPWLGRLADDVWLVACRCGHLECLGD